MSCFCGVGDFPPADGEKDLQLSQPATLSLGILAPADPAEAIVFKPFKEEVSDRGVSIAPLPAALTRRRRALQDAVENRVPQLPPASTKVEQFIACSVHELHSPSRGPGKENGGRDSPPGDEEEPAPATSPRTDPPRVVSPRGVLSSRSPRSPRVATSPGTPPALGDVLTDFTSGDDATATTPVATGGKREDVPALEEDHAHMLACRLADPEGGRESASEYDTECDTAVQARGAKLLEGSLLEEEKKEEGRSEEDEHSKSVRKANPIENSLLEEEKKEPDREAEERELERLRTEKQEFTRRQAEDALAALDAAEEEARLHAEPARLGAEPSVWRYQSELEALKREMDGMRERQRLETELATTKLLLAQEKDKQEEFAKEAARAEEVRKLKEEVASLRGGTEQDEVRRLREEVSMHRITDGGMSGGQYLGNEHLPPRSLSISQSYHPSESFSDTMEMQNLLNQRKDMLRREAEELANLVDGGLDALQYRVHGSLRQPSLQSMQSAHSPGGLHEDPHIYQKIGRQLMSERTLSGTSRSSSDAPSFGGTPSRSSRLDVASLLPDMHPAVAARIAQGWALVPGRPGYMRPPGAAPGSSAEQYVPEAGPRGPNDRSSGNPEQGYDTPPRHGGVPDNISFTQTAENDAAGQGCAEYLAPPGVNDVALEEIFLRLEAAKSKLQECTTDDIAKQIETVELIDRLAGAAISLQKLAPPPML